MPARFIGPMADIIFGGVAAMLFFLSDALAGTSLSVPIWDKTDLIKLCVAGSMAGAYMYIIWFQKRGPLDVGHEYVRKLASKFLAAGVAGVVFTPMVMKWTHIPLDPDFVLGISALVALCGVSVMQRAVPRISDWVYSRLPGSKTDDPEPKDEEATNHHA